MEFIMN